MLGTVMPTAAFAQGGRFVTGPLTWTPTLQLRDAGIDSNVFNTPTDTKQDTTAAASAQVASLLTLGILQAATNGTLEYNYFERYTNQRGVNGRVQSHLDFPVTRFSPDLTVSYAHVKERANNEIDTRAPRTDFAYAAGIQTRLTSRISVIAAAGQQRYRYERGVTFRGVELAGQLDRDSLVATLTTRVALTPLTTMVVDGSVGRDQFVLKPDTDTDNIRVNAGLEFAPDAIIRGRGAIGYHSMKPRHGGAANTAAASFDGLTWGADLGYTLLDVTRVNARLSRDANYSATVGQPTYLSMNTGLEVLQTLFGPVDLDVRAGREQLEYKRTPLAAAHTDHADMLGGGLSFRLATNTVLALLYENMQRRSTAGAQFEYTRRRVYTTLTYGF